MLYYLDYNIPSNNRELQLLELIIDGSEIITYQVITGNYSGRFRKGKRERIITYQVITGNYSMAYPGCNRDCIITYQVITGNYS